MALSTVGIVSVIQYQYKHKQLATYTVTTSDPYFTQGAHDTCASSVSLSLYLSHWMSYCLTVATCFENIRNFQGESR